MINENLNLSSKNTYHINFNSVQNPENILISCNNDSKYYNVFITSDKESLIKIADSYPCSLILFCTNDSFENNHDNVLLINSPFEKNISLQLSNILLLSKKIKESYFRKIILLIKNETNIHKIYQYLKEIGFLLKKYNKNKIKSAKLKNNKKFNKIYDNSCLKGFYTFKDENIYYFKSTWHEDSIINHELIDELINSLTETDFFKMDFKNDYKLSATLTLLEKEDFLGNHIGEGLFVIDLDGKITFINKIFCNMLSIKKENILGKDLSEIIPKDVNYKILFKKFRLNNEPVFKNIKINLLGMNNYFNIVFAPIFENGRILFVSGIIRDITHQKIIEKGIKVSKIETEQANKKLLTLQNAIILGFSKLSEYKDKETGGHLERIQNYTKILSQKLYSSFVFIDYSSKKNYLSDSYINEVTLSSLLHDIGKVGIPDNILLKPGRLSFDESKYMQMHAKIGGDTLKFIDSIVGEVSFLALAKKIAYFHHEKWNGLGYPYGLKHENIPLCARIVALCDVYDALTTKRPYKEKYTHEKSCEIIYDQAGHQFDPVIVSVFSLVEKDFKNIAKKFSE